MDAWSDTAAHPRGGRLLLATTWVAAVLTLSLVLAGVPPRFAALQQVCAAGNCSPLQLTAAAAQELAARGMSARFYAVYLVTFELTVPLVFAAVGAVLLWRGPRDRAALVVSLMLVTYGAYLTPFVTTMHQAAPGWRPLATLVHALALVASLLVLYLFPDGRFVPRWTRVLAVVWLIWTLAWLIVPDLPFNPSDPYRLPVRWLLVYALWYCGGVGFQIYRYRRVSDAVERQQTKWIVFGASVAAGGFVTFLVGGQLLAVLSDAASARVLFTLVGMPLLVGSLLLIPLSITMAVLRYRLWDIDLLINRTLVYGVLSTLLALIYLSGVVLLQRVFLRLTGGTSSLAVVGATLGSAALVRPLRQRIQVFIDRRFYRRKYDAQRTLQVFGEGLRNETDLASLADELITVVADTFEPAQVTLWLPPASRDRTRA